VDGGQVTPSALTTAVHHVFVATAVLAVVMLAATLLMPRDRGNLPTSTPKPSETAAG
jgi:hypothetical protein